MASIDDLNFDFMADSTARNLLLFYFYISSFARCADVTHVAWKYQLCTVSHLIQLGSVSLFFHISLRILPGVGLWLFLFASLPSHFDMLSN